MVTFVKEFENFILSEEEGALPHLISGSQAEVYMNLVNEIKKLQSKGKVEDSLRQALERASEKLPWETINQSKLIILLKEFDLDSSDEKRKREIIDDIFSLFFSNKIRFDFSQPTNIRFNQNSSINENDTKKISSHLDQSLFSINKLVEDYTRRPEDPKSISELNSILPEIFFENIKISSLPYKTLFKQILIDRRVFLPIWMLKMEDIKLLAEFLDEFCDKMTYQPNIDDLLKSMTIDSLERLNESITSHYFDKSSILIHLINKKYKSKFSLCNDDKERYTLYLEIFNYIPNIPKFKTLRINILVEILEKGSKLQIFNLEHFLLYLASPLTCDVAIYKVKQNQVAQKRWNLLNTSSTIDERSIVNTYLTHFFMWEKEKTLLSKFSEFLNEDLVKSVYYKSCVLSGEENEAIIKHFKSDKFESLVKSSEITILKHNKEQFLCREEVALQVDIKNVPTLFVKIFEINTENYYWTKKAAINTAISLEGLIPSYEETFVYSEKPQTLVRRTFVFDKIENRRGLYVIEFIGGGMSSRAVIKKGALNIVTRATHKGKMIFVLDEEDQMCSDETTGIWFAGKFYTCDRKRGEEAENNSLTQNNNNMSKYYYGSITIPYMRSAISEGCIIKHQNFAEFASLSVEEEVYNLKGTFIFNHESFMMGNNATIIFRPFLCVNNRETRVDYLKNAKITASLAKMENGVIIPVTFTFDSLKVSRDNEITFEIQIPPKLVKVDFVFEAEINNYSKEKKETLRVSQLVYATSSNEDNQLVKFYLRKVESQYLLSLLGKNGEVKPDSQVNLTFNLNTMTKVLNATLRSDENGEVHLGELKSVTNLTATTTYNNAAIRNTWELGLDKVHSYPNSMDVLKGESIRLPYYGNAGIEFTQNVRLIKLDEEGAALRIIQEDSQESDTTKLKLEAVNENNNRFNILIENLTTGNYLIKIGTNYSITITVHEGRFWESENFIIKSDKIIENSEFKFPIYIKNLSIETNNNSNGNTEKTLKINIASKSQNSRVHILTHSYLPEQGNKVVRDMLSIFNSANLHSEHPFQKWKNFFLSNRQLNEEIQYVLDRKYFDRCLGNSLEKPSLVLKRQFLRDTTWEEEAMHQGTEFARLEAEVARGREIPTCQTMNNQISASLFGQQSLTATNYLKCPTPGTAISDFHNFLKFSPLVISNLKPDRNGDITLTNLPLSNYSHLTVIAIDEKSVCEETVNLSQVKVLRRDLTLSSPLDVDKTFAEVRKTQRVQQKNKVDISDITSVTYKIVDCLEKVVNFKLLINPALKTTWSKFAFVLKDLTNEERKKKFSNFFSHELNVLFYFKNREFFEDFVKPVLKFKSEKTFIDFFLLDDREALEKFTNPVEISKLSAFEKCLLISYLVNNVEGSSSNNSHLDLANYISESMRSEASNCKTSPEETKRLFNILMNMRSDDNTSNPDSTSGFGGRNIETNQNIQYIQNKSNLISNMAMQNVFQSVSNMNFQQNSTNFNNNNSNFAFNAPMMNVSQNSNDLFGQVNFNQQQQQTQNYGANMRRSDPFKECEQKYCEEEGEEGYYGEEEETMKNARNNLYKNSGVTKEYVESHFWNNSGTSLYIPATNFWADYAQHLIRSKGNNSTPFLSENILCSTDSFPSLIFSLAVLDLPLVACSHQFNRSEGLSMKIVANSNLILFTKEITESKAEINSNLMIAQNVSDPADSEDKVVKDYLVNKVLAHETIITNISECDLDYELLIQVPQGSLPVFNSDYTRTVHGRLAKFNTVNYKTYFYFPNVGSKFVHYPPNAAIEGVTVARGEVTFYNVVNQLSVGLSKENFEDVLNSGKDSEILNFIKEKLTNDTYDKTNTQLTQLKQFNIAEVLPKVYWLVKNKNFYLTLINLLRQNGIYDNVVWSFAFLHYDYPTIKDYLEKDQTILSLIGPYFTSSLLQMSDTNNYSVLNHLDYSPIFNARVHRLGKDTTGILNREFKDTYERFILYLLRIDSAQLTAKLLLRLASYLILQDRFEEALRVFSRIDTREFNQDSSLDLQYDYLAAYLDFSFGFPHFRIAKENCERYKDFPLLHWRELFEEIEDQLIEYEGKELVSDVDALVDEEVKTKKLKKAVAREDDTVHFVIENKTLAVTTGNRIKNITIKFYSIDLEVLFSRFPFIKSNSDDFSFVQPNYVNSLEVKSEGNAFGNVTKFNIPNEFVTRNLFIEVCSENKKTFDTYFSTSLKVTVSENLGEVKVVDEGHKPMSKVYVKSFARMKDGSVTFYKDGYTDLRGKFNYLSLNTDRLKQVDKFSVLVLHDELGSVIKEASPPANLGGASSDYENLQNYRQDFRNVWRTYNKKK